jgi:hypothetical protein
MITVRRPVVKRCPYKDEADAGELTITFPKNAPELHRLAAWVDSLCGDPITHEEFTRTVADHLGTDVLVITTWHTGPWSVEVREGDDLLREPEYRACAAGDA